MKTQTTGIIFTTGCAIQCYSQISVSLMHLVSSASKKIVKLDDDDRENIFLCNRKLK